MKKKVIYFALFTIFGSLTYCQDINQKIDTSFYGIYSEFPHSCNRYFINSRKLIINSGNFWQHCVYNRNLDTLLLSIDTSYHSFDDWILNYKFCILRERNIIVHWYDCNESEVIDKLYRLNFWLKLRTRIYNIFHRKRYYLW